jgi:hypothetical protein
MLLLNCALKGFYLLGPCCRVVRGFIRNSRLTRCVSNDAAWPQCRAFFYEILLLKLSLTITDQNRI